MDQVVKIPETRGGGNKRYDFDNFLINETRSYTNSTTGHLLNSAKSYCKRQGLDWKFRCYTLNDLTHIIRIK